jgi:uncharacterized protein (UPF0335 family)
MVRAEKIFKNREQFCMVEVGGIAADRLRQFIERIERLEEEKTALASDVREVYGEAKSVGFDPKIMRAIIKLRGMDTADQQEMEALIDTYKHALGME